MKRLILPGIAIAVALMVAAGVIIALVSRHGSSVTTTNTSDLAAQINAKWCADSGFYLKNRLDGSKGELYNCNMPNGSYKCVTVENDIPADVTVEAKIVFQSMLGSTKPDCVRF